MRCSHQNMSIFIRKSTMKPGNGIVVAVKALIRNDHQKIAYNRDNQFKGFGKIQEFKFITDRNMTYVDFVTLGEALRNMNEKKLAEKNPRKKRSLDELLACMYARAMKQTAGISMWVAGISKAVSKEDFKFSFTTFTTMMIPTAAAVAITDQNPLLVSTEPLEPPPKSMDKKKVAVFSCLSFPAEESVEAAFSKKQKVSPSSEFKWISFKADTGSRKSVVSARVDYESSYGDRHFIVRPISAIGW